MDDVTSDREFITFVEGVPSSSSPISHAVVVGGTCWISGQMSVDEGGSYLPGNVREEAERAFALTFRIAEQAGFAREEIVYVDLAFLDLRDLAEVNRVYAELFMVNRRPARTIYQAAGLPFGAKIKVQVVAARVP